MGSVRDSNERLSGLEPYDPKYLPAEVMLSANESPFDIAPDTRAGRGPVGRACLQPLPGPACQRTS